jgi:hypothetical protein
MGSPPSVVEAEGWSSPRSWSSQGGETIESNRWATYILEVDTLFASGSVAFVPRAGPEEDDQEEAVSTSASDHAHSAQGFNKTVRYVSDATVSEPSNPPVTSCMKVSQQGTSLAPWYAELRSVMLQAPAPRFVMDSWYKITSSRVMGEYSAKFENGLIELRLDLERCTFKTHDDEMIKQCFATEEADFERVEFEFTTKSCGRKKNGGFKSTGCLSKCFIRLGGKYGSPPLLSKFPEKLARLLDQIVAAYPARVLTSVDGQKCLAGFSKDYIRWMVEPPY